MRIVFDVSARESGKNRSLNDCLETGPSLQNLLWNVFLLNRRKSIALSADLIKAFFQVLIRVGDGDSLRFHWIENKDPSDIEVLRFTRALFGLVQSPFFLAATLKQHLNGRRERYPKEVEEIEKCLYVDDIITGGCTNDEVLNLKETTIFVFEEATFELHKWHSNEPQLESAEVNNHVVGHLTELLLNFLQCVPEKVHLARSIPRYIEPLEEVELHTIGDARWLGISAVVYAVVRQPSRVSVRLVGQNRDWPRSILQFQGWNWYPGIMTRI
jgi:hypothetical protein